MPLESISLLLILIIGSLTGFFSGFLGVGGGFILVPLLIFIGFPAYIAIGSSLAYIAFIGVAGAIQHYRQGKCDVKIAATMLPGGVITAQLGAIATSYFNSKLLESVLALILIGTAIRMIILKDQGTVTLEKCEYNVPLTIVIGLVVGFLSGLLGVGGGFILVPLMVIMMKMPIHIAVGTSLVEVFGLSVSGALRHWLMGNIDLLLVSILVVGGVIFSPLGAMLTKRFNDKQLRLVFCAVLLIFAFRMLVFIFYSI